MDLKSLVLRLKNIVKELAVVGTESVICSGVRPKLCFINRLPFLLDWGCKRNGHSTLAIDFLGLGRSFS